MENDEKRVKMAAAALVADCDADQHTHTCQGCNTRYACTYEIVDYGFDSDMDCRWHEYVLCPACLKKAKVN